MMNNCTCEILEPGGLDPSFSQVLELSENTMQKEPWVLNNNLSMKRKRP